MLHSLPFVFLHSLHLRVYPSFLVLQLFILVFQVYETVPKPLDFTFGAAVFHFGVVDYFIEKDIKLDVAIKLLLPFHQLTLLVLVLFFELSDLILKLNHMILSSSKLFVFFLTLKLVFNHDCNV